MARMGVGGPPLDCAVRRVAMLIYPGVTPLDVTGPLQVFDMANRLRKQLLYDIATVAPTAEPVPDGGRIRHLGTPGSGQPILAETRLSLKGTAHRCGFGSVAAMRRAFMLRVGVPPRQYRDNFRA